MNSNLKDWIFKDQPVLKHSSVSESPWALVSSLLPNLFILAGIIVFFILVAAGFLFVSSYSNPERLKQAKELGTFAIIGFVVIFASYWIIQIIEIITGVTILF